MRSKHLLLMLLLALMAPWAAMGQSTLTVCDGSSTNTYIPVYGSYVDTEGAKSEFIIPAETEGMSALEGGTISKLTFYISGTPATWGSPTIQVYMGEVEETTIGAIHSPSDFTIVSTSVWSNQSTTIEVELDDPYTYEGGNLLIGTYVQTESSTYNSTSFFGVSALSGSSRYYTSYGTGTAQSFLPKTTFTYTPGTPNPCKKPTGLEATLTPGNGAIARLNWTENGEATSWVLQYGSDDEFGAGTYTEVTTGFTVSGTNVTANLTGLTAEQTYYARVKPNCDTDGSKWSATCEFTPTNALTKTINDGTKTNNRVPVYAYWADATQRSEFIIPASSLSSLNGSILKSMKFYANFNYTSTKSFQVYLKEVTEDVFSGTTFYTAEGATTVYNNTITVSSTDGMTITFSEGFEYNGGNLLVGFYQATSGNAGSSSNSFYGIEATGSSLSAYSSYSAAQQNFLPKVTFSYLTNPFPKPKNLAVSNITNEGATATWEAPTIATPTGYKYQYKSEGGTWSTLTSTTALSANLTNLDDNTEYTVQVQAIYAGGESEFATKTFTTLCDPYEIPYQYGFEDEEIADMNCWTIFDVYERAHVTNNTAWGEDHARTGEGFFIFTFKDYPDTNPQYMTLISPELTGNDNGLHVEFYYLTDGQSSYPETFRVGYSTTNTDLSSFTWSNTITDAVAADYQLFKANYPAGTKFVAVQHLSDDMDFLVLDDFSFTEAPSCTEPSNLQVSNITTSGAALSWTIGGEATAWDIYVTDDDTDVPDDETTPTYAGVTSNTNCPISGLTSGTTYYVYVRSACDATTNSDWTMPTSFNTACEAISLPYQYDFEDDALPVCWNTIGTNSGWIISFISNTAPQHGSKHFVIQTSNNSTGTQYVVLPEVDANYPLNEYEITFYSELAGYTTTGRTLAVGVMTDPTDASTFVQIGDAFTPSTTYEQYKVRLNTYTGSGHYIAIKHVITSYSSYASDTYIDNLEVSLLPACLEPSDPVVSNITNHTAKLDWTGTSAGYNIDYRTAAYNDASKLDEHFTGLTTGIPTNWDNSEGTTTTASNKWSYNNSGHDAAPCVRFNSYSNSNGNTNFLKTPSMEFPAGKTMQLSFWWKNPTGGDFSVYISTDGGTNKTLLKGGMIGQSTWKQETFNLESYAGSTVTIHFKGTSNYGSGDAYIYLDDVVIGEEIPAGEWQHATASTNTKTLTGLLAQKKYEVRVQGDCGSEGTSEWSGIVSFTTDIPCPAPTSLTYSNLKSNRVDLSWTNGGSEDWIVAYKLGTDTDFTEVPVTTSDVTISGTTVTYTLSGLTPEKEYNVKVQDNCEASYAGDGTSEWTSTITFETLEACAKPTDVTFSNIKHTAADVTWTGDSPSFTVSYNTAAYINGVDEEFAASSIPSGWTQYVGLFDETEGTATLSSGSRWYFGNNNGVFNSHARTNNYSSYNSWLVTPSFTVPTGASFSFDVALTKYSGNNYAVDPQKQADDKFMVLISTNNKSSWTVLRKWDNAGSSYVYNELPATADGLTVNDIDISTYAGQTVYIAFYAESTNGEGANGGDNNLHIDNVLCGTSVPAGTTKTITVTESTATLTNLLSGRKYQVVITPSCDASSASDPVFFTTVADNVKLFLTEGDWATATNWDGGIPTIADEAIIKANATIANGTVAEAMKITFQGTPTPTLTIANGGQLKTDNTVTATVKKTINAYPTEGKAGYYLIGNPLSSDVSYSTYSTPNTTSVGLVTSTSNYDLYRWITSSTENYLEWRNYKSSTFSLSNGTGYLYANAANVELTFTGTVKANNVDVTKNPSFTTTGTLPEFNGWNLYANPFVCNAYITSVDENESETPMAFYKMNAAGNNYAAATGAIAPMEGVFVQATKEGQSFKFSRTAPAVTNPGQLNINLAQNTNTRDAIAETDNAIVRFDGGMGLEKFSFREGSSKVFIPQEGKDYAVVSAEAQGEMPVSFKAEKNGSYTLSFSNEEVTFSYLHLIDNMTGKDVNLLETPSYSFEAKTTDYASRFKLVFSTGNSVNDESFAFISDGSIILNGEGMLQVVDVMGRIMMQEENATSVSTSGMTPGVYVLRLINGDSVRTQKIVIK